MSGVVSDPVAILDGALRIYSPTGEEARLADYLFTRMKRLGYRKVRVDRAGNALGEIGSGGPRILLCGHMDTVPGRLPVSCKEGKLFGRGASDAKSALCALLVAGSRASDARLSVTFAGVTQEEGNSDGIQAIIRSKKHYDCAVFGEPSGANRLAIGYRGRFGMRLTIETEGGHAASPWAYVSAVDEFNSILASLRKFENGRSVADDHFRSLSISPTLVEAGTYHNVIPPICKAAFDVRLPPGQTAAAVQKELKEIIAGSHKERTIVRVEFDEATEAYEADPNSKLVRSFQRAVILKLKTKPIFVRKTSSGDMNTFAAATGAECVTYGPADSKLSHTNMEGVSVRDYLDSIDVLTEAMKQLEQLSRSS
jgi:LysW-gamma-L-lysine carboxypeptidase